MYDQEPLADDHPLRTLPNVVLTPHLGYAAQEFFEKAYGDTIENISAFLSGARGERQLSGTLIDTHDGGY